MSGDGSEPSYKNSDSSSEYSALHANNAIAFTERLLEKTQNDMITLQTRFNGELMENLELRSENEFLISENDRLKSLVRGDFWSYPGGSSTLIERQLANALEDVKTLRARLGDEIAKKEELSSDNQFFFDENQRLCEKVKNRETRVIYLTREYEKRAIDMTREYEKRAIDMMREYEKRVTDLKHEHEKEISVLNDAISFRNKILSENWRTINAQRVHCAALKREDKS